STQADGPGWGAGWRSVGVANLRRAGGEGLLEAGSDVFPNDPRPVAFAVDYRVLDAEIAAAIARVGTAAGVVLRRRSPSAYYAALYDTERGALRILARDGVELRELAGAPVPSAGSPITLTLEAVGADPTSLRAELVDAAGGSFAATASDATPALQRRGDPGVLATARTLFPSDRNPALPALGNLHLLPWGVQEGQAFMDTAPGEAIIDEIRRRSTAAFAEIVVGSPERARPTRPTVVAATTGAPVPGGARLHLASDLSARAELELSYSPRFRRSRTLPAGRTGRFHAVAKTVRGLEPGRRVYWRARLRRRGQRVSGPVRSFRVPPVAGGEAPFRIAVAACGAQFGPIFEHLAARRPDVFVWQGDLNYPDTHGPLAQTMSGYAGIWRDFLANPLLAPTLSRAAFAGQRDDHDYGVQDANSTNVDRFPWGLAPWEALVNPRTFYRFPAGAAEVWVLDQRMFKSDPTLPDGPEKTLLGSRQRRWLLRTLAASKARFKVICSPATVFMPANPRDGNWAVGFEAERELLLDRIRRRVRGTTIFLTGDTHLTGVYDADGDFEARAAPVGIPTPNDITLIDPLAAENLRGRPGVVYAGDENHFTMLELRGRGRSVTLELSLVREDGATTYARRFAGA
ncbi:MAG: alkaline phosphatase D family protein, partial [Candidatus Limnocylindria bacterium]